MPTITATAAISGNSIVVSGAKTLGTPADIAITLSGPAGVVSAATVSAAPDGAYSASLPLPPASATAYAIHVSTSGTTITTEAATLTVPAPAVAGALVKASIIEDVAISGAKATGAPGDVTVSVDGAVVKTFPALADGPWATDAILASGDHPVTVATAVPVSASADTTVLVNPPLTLTLEQNGTGIVARGTRNLGATAAPIYVYVYAPGSTYAGHGVTTISGATDGPFVSGIFGSTLPAGTPWQVEVRTPIGSTTYSQTAQIVLSAVPVTPPPVQPPTSGGTTTTPPPPAVVGLPAPPPAPAGIAALFDIQNNGTATIPARIIRTARPFKAGALPSSLAGVQVDALQTHADGSVNIGGIVLHVPDIAPGTAYRASLAAGAAIAGAPVPVTAAPLLVAVNVKAANGAALASPQLYSFDLSADLAASTDCWLHGPLATQARVRKAVTAALSIVVDTTFYADGRIENDVQFRNTAAFGPAGGDLTYDVTISYGGVVRFHRTDIPTHWQYQCWHAVVWAVDEPVYCVSHPPADLMATPAFHDWDYKTGADPSNTPSANYGILSNGPYPMYMGSTGVPADIGPDPEWIAAWLMTQTQAGRDYAVQCADCMGSIPWHMEDVSTGDWVSVITRPNFWADGRQSTADGGLTQQLPQAGSYRDASGTVIQVPLSGWNLDVAHQPDGTTAVYCLTGNRYYHDLMVGQAAFSVLSMNPGNGYRYGAQGIVVTSQAQVRGIAWGKRQVLRVAFFSKKHGAEYATILDHNFDYLLTQAAGANQGEASWWVQGQYGAALQIAPWQQDYVADVLCEADKKGYAKAHQLLLAHAGFTAGRFLPQAGGWKQVNGIVYNMQTMTDASFTAIQTWAAIQAATGPVSGAGAAPNGWTALDGTPWPTNTFLQYYLNAISVLRYCAKHCPEDPRFAQARDWLTANAPFCNAAAFRGNPAYSFAA